MHVHSQSRRFGLTGFSLIELLVGIAIGLIGMLVMYKTVTLWNGRTQATIAVGDAQVSGTLAIYALERDIKLAGMGFSQAAGDLGCTVQMNDALSPSSPFTFLPVEIVDGTPAGVPDVVRVLYGNSPIAPLRQLYQASTATSKKMTNSRNGFQPGDVAIVTDGVGGTPSLSKCALLQITANTNHDGFTLDHAAGSYTDYYTGNAMPARYDNVSPDTLVGATLSSGNLYSLGNAPRRNEWSVVGDSLQAVDTLHGTTAANYAEGIVDMKAYYGIDTNLPPDKQISNAEWTKAPPATTDWSNLLAVRVALLVRSRNYEPATNGDASAQFYSAPNPSYTDPANPGGPPIPFVMHDIGGTTDTNPTTGTNRPNNWRFYRYRVYERVIPLRNMLWCNTVPAC